MLCTIWSSQSCKSGNKQRPQVGARNSRTKFWRFKHFSKLWSRLHAQLLTPRWTWNTNGRHSKWVSGSSQNSRSWKNILRKWNPWIPYRSKSRRTGHNKRVNNLKTSNFNKWRTSCQRTDWYFNECIHNFEIALLLREWWRHCNQINERYSNFLYPSSELWWV